MRRCKLRVDMVGLVVSIGAIIVAIVLIWFAGKLGEYEAMSGHEEISSR